ncbi:hypothetical protein LOTGIDRAFT_199138 [Lottia gigantea]|uniref:Protein rolling stone n=1 Tax=Lottia gigantea TaxID=225164 RepID=V4AHJ2_LOTGI|nr:hypothetical protein LOTGIDRAFT_199138 [Lottia gigantea]ESP03529.1 hypothetical protein LOTGIDRAFT_199138 [Lottia gigantea]
MGTNKCKEHFYPRNFLLSYDKPHHFTTFEWGWPSGYLLWRVVWALYHIIWIILTGVYAWQWTTTKSNEIKWFIYLTHWAYFVLTLSSLMELIAVIHIHCKRTDILKGECKEMSGYLKFVWVMFNVSNTASIAVSILFWALLYSDTYPLTTVDIATHLLNSAYVLSNLIITAVPVRIYHFFHPVLFSTLYIIFTVIYQEAGGSNGLDKPYIYSVIDWRTPDTAALYSVLAALVLTPISHVIVFIFYLIRKAIFDACLKNTGQ